MNRNQQLADRLSRFAGLLDPNKIAGHRSQAEIMREAAKIILALDQQVRSLHKELDGVNS